MIDPNLYHIHEVRLSCGGFVLPRSSDNGATWVNFYGKEPKTSYQVNRAISNIPDAQEVPTLPENARVLW